MRASAVEAARAHNPEVVGSNSTPATKAKTRGAAIKLPSIFGATNLIVESTLERDNVNYTL